RPPVTRYGLSKGCWDAHIQDTRVYQSSSSSRCVANGRCRAVLIHTDHPVDVITDLPAFLGKVQDWLGQYFFTLFEDERVAIGLSLAILVAGATVLCIVLSKVILARLAVAKLIRAVE